MKYNEFGTNIIADYEKIKDADPSALSQTLVLEYMRQVPTSIDSPEDLSNIANLLGELTNLRTYLTGIHTRLRTEARISKRNKENKVYAEDMAIRRDIVEAAIDSVKAQYDACSRMLTAYKMQIDELRMLGDGPRYGGKS